MIYHSAINIFIFTYINFNIYMKILLNITKKYQIQHIRFNIHN